MHDLHWNVAAPERAKKPVIAAIEKWAMGVSFELSLACDFRLATENSTLALPEINLGGDAGKRRNGPSCAPRRVDPREGDDHARAKD
jgi:2-oxoglutaroyl-CoA hydrolase